MSGTGTYSYQVNTFWQLKNIGLFRRRKEREMVWQDTTQLSGIVVLLVTQHESTGLLDYSIPRYWILI